jgi:hypothetical protein
MRSASHRFSSAGLISLCMVIIVTISGCSGAAHSAGAQQPSPTAQSSTPGGRPSALKTYDELLADQLGTSIDKLRAAQSQAGDRYFEQLTRQGTLNEDQAKLLKHFLPAELASGLFSLFDLQSLQESFLEQASNILGIDKATLDQELAQGKSLRQIAADHSVSRERLYNKLDGAIDDLFAQLENLGVITSDEAQRLNAQLDDFLERLKENRSPAATPVP